MNASDVMIRHGYLPIFSNEKWCMEEQLFIKLPWFWPHGAQHGFLSMRIHLKTVSYQYFDLTF